MSRVQSVPEDMSTTMPPSVLKDTSLDLSVPEDMSSAPAPHVPEDMSSAPAPHVPEDMYSAPTARLRTGVADDLPAILAIKQRLRLQADAPGRGGFLLGTSPAQYARLIAHGRTQVLSCGGAVVGFAAALADAELRASELWRRREQIDLGPRRALLDELERLPLAYLDQLALLPEPGLAMFGVLLAYHALAALFAEGCAVVVTTVVDEPVRNLASRPLLAAVAALQVGRIAEHYEGFGAITSDVFIVPRAALDPAAQTDPRRRARLLRLAAAAHSLTRAP